MSRRRFIRRVAATLAITVLTGPLFAAFAPQSGADAAGGYPLREVGSVPIPKGPVKSPQSQAKVLAIDPVARRMYYMYGDSDANAWLVTYDISAPIPKQVLPVAPMGKLSEYDKSTRYTVAFDAKRRQLAILSDAYRSDSGSGPEDTGTHSIVVFSAPQNRIVGRWDITTKILPGFAVMGLTYAARDDRYYLVGEFTANRKTNATNKTDKEACEISFVSAVLSLQQRARREGGDAVVNIHSVYKNENRESDSEYLCGAGTFAAGVALRGTVVKLKEVKEVKAKGKGK